ncbi:MULTISPECIES: HAD-IA family hydrolase [unclassified Pseudoalteromonas]|uniref:HAD-IA family hydrolase n=1 Tax=unclassified Pseudoalteromonas TaxID=194690 RepID=UPI0011081B9B|nr:MULTISPECIES: HAD-IA family hydrolase [unclassified Pseudoalteromonas]TMN83768.1 hypothetical protein CWB64_07095 [Pseudoalteromonas sp. S410]TMN88909.1 hypothetical protein CWB62_14210 [Pseudoalteromonas sp. S408]TMN95305.1 hypothetical protein CWB63_18200 [Pseudoalteromonas sp. S409]TMN96107.1 hypothetical protein CWB61_13240 [Pseudoalteromonas sp. S407]TMO07440.1 hypothetical protein CWB57_15995 [Pseudoalteromonas sp. S186]
MGKISAVLFDLDDTLVFSSHLKSARETRDIRALRRLLPSTQLCKNILTLIEGLSRKGIPLGIVTNSPKWYADEVLNYFELFGYFSVIVYYDDVRPNIKPSPLGINLALERLSISKPESVLYIGDHQVDIDAAYSSHVIPIAPTWADTKIPQMPACVICTKALLKEIDSIENIRLLAESASDNTNLYFQIGREFYFCPINLEAQVVMPGRRNIQIITFGRYFSTKSKITANLAASHKLSIDIQSKEQNSNFEAPKYWVDTFVFALQRIPQYLYRNNEGVDIVTVIPAKQLKNKRLERMLRRIHEKSGLDYHFIDDIFQFSENAISLKTVNGRRERQVAVNGQLHLNQKYKGKLKGAKIIILDDVVTTGATFKRAISLLEVEEAEKVLGLCLAKTVHPIGDTETCDRCNRPMRCLTNKYGIKFWACTGYQEPIPCNHAKGITIKDCPRCAKELVLKSSQYGKYLAHEGEAAKHCQYKENR